MAYCMSQSMIMTRSSGLWHGQPGQNCLRNSIRYSCGYCRNWLRQWSRSTTAIHWRLTCFLIIFVIFPFRWCWMRYYIALYCMNTRWTV